MKIQRRDKLKIYGDLLFALRSESSTEKIVLSRVQNRTRVPFDRLKIYITELANLGLIEDETNMKITKKGTEYLREYEKVLDFMKRMGIAYR